MFLCFGYFTQCTGRRVKVASERLEADWSFFLASNGMQFCSYLLLKHSVTISARQSNAAHSVSHGTGHGRRWTFCRVDVLQVQQMVQVVDISEAFALKQCASIVYRCLCLCFVKAAFVQHCLHLYITRLQSKTHKLNTTNKYTTNQ